MMTMKINIQLKLTAAFTAAMICVLAYAYFFLSSHMTGYFLQRFDRNLQQELSLAKEMVAARGTTSLGQDEAQRICEAVSKAVGVRVTVINPAGTVLGDSEVGRAGVGKMENHADRPEVQAALKGSVGSSTRYSYTIRMNMRYMAMAFGEGPAKSVLRFAVPLEELEHLKERIRLIVFSAFLFAVILGVVLSFLISHLVTRPLREMSFVAMSLARGDFSKRMARSYSYDEIGDLGKALNHMADEIQERISQVQSGSVKMDTVLASMYEGVLVTDVKGAILMMNPSIRKMFMVEEPPQGRQVLEVVRNTKVQDIVERITRGNERVASGEVTVVSPEEKVVRVNGAAIVREGSTEGAVLVFHDITELRKLERIRQDFVANVSHELRTPIASIKGYAETLKDGALADKENAKDFVDIIWQDSERLAKLIDDLLDLAKIESGKMNMVFLPMPLRPVALRVSNVLQKAASDKNIVLAVDVPEDLPKVLADEARISQVLLNLMDNAIKYTPEGGRVTVTAANYEGFLRVDVADTGFGIPESDLPRIFERFYRVDKARSKELGGTGLGLSIVKHIVQAHSGQVFVHSTLGAGTMFTFTLPLAK